MNSPQRTRAALVGCSASNGSGGQPADGPLTLYTWLSSDSDRQQWDDFITGAQKVDPELEVEVEGPSFAEYWTKVKTRLAGDNPPCLLTTQAARAQELDELLMPLGDLIAKHGLDIGAYDESMLAGMTVDGGIRAIPYDAEPICSITTQTPSVKQGLSCRALATHAISFSPMQRR